MINFKCSKKDGALLRIVTDRAFNFYKNDGLNPRQRLLNPW